MKEDNGGISTSISIRICDMKDGCIVSFWYNNVLYRPNKIGAVEVKDGIKQSNKKVRKRMVNKVDKWIKNNNIRRFTVDQIVKSDKEFYYHPDRLTRYLSGMVEDRTLVQMGNDVFVVNNSNSSKEVVN